MGSRDLSRRRESKREVILPKGASRSPEQKKGAGGRCPEQEPGSEGPASLPESGAPGFLG